jgi:hypothetical protein
MEALVLLRTLDFKSEETKLWDNAICAGGRRHALRLEVVLDYVILF